MSNILMIDKLRKTCCVSCNFWIFTGSGSTHRTSSREVQYSGRRTKVLRDAVPKQRGVGSTTGRTQQ